MLECPSKSRKTAMFAPACAHQIAAQRIAHAQVDEDVGRIQQEQQQKAYELFGERVP